MRPRRRRRPAGLPQVPIHRPPPPVVGAPTEPTLVRLGLDRGVIDAPWRLHVIAMAHVWPDARLPGGWARVAWPVDAVLHRFVAPLDLQIGHVVEVTTFDCARCYGWVADADAKRFVLVPGSDAASAVTAATRAVEVWHAAELAAVDEEWRARVDQIRRLRGECR